jgi:hypothetical protein
MVYVTMPGHVFRLIRVKAGDRSAKEEEKARLQEVRSQKEPLECAAS